MVEHYKSPAVVWCGLWGVFSPRGPRLSSGTGISGLAGPPVTGGQPGPPGTPRCCWGPAAGLLSPGNTRILEYYSKTAEQHETECEINHLSLLLLLLLLFMKLFFLSAFQDINKSLIFFEWRSKENWRNVINWMFRFRAADRIRKVLIKSNERTNFMTLNLKN